MQNFKNLHIFFKKSKYLSDNYTLKNYRNQLYLKIFDFVITPAAVNWELNWLVNWLGKLVSTYNWVKWKIVGIKYCGGN